MDQVPSIYLQKAYPHSATIHTSMDLPTIKAHTFPALKAALLHSVHLYKRGGQVDLCVGARYMVGGSQGCGCFRSGNPGNLVTSA